MWWLEEVVRVGVLWVLVSIPVGLAVARILGAVSPVGRSGAPPTPTPRRPPLALPEHV